MASEHAVGGKHVISSGLFPALLVVKFWLGVVPSPARSMKLQMVILQIFSDNHSYLVRVLTWRA